MFTFEEVSPVYLKRTVSLSESGDGEMERALLSLHERWLVIVPQS